MMSGWQEKLCGMLNKMDIVNEQVSFLNIGIGINVNNDPTADEPNATHPSSGY